MDEVAKVNLEKPLLLRDPKSSLLSVNFDPQLVALLREVKYLDQREGSEQQIPESAAGIFSQHEMYRKFLQVCVHINQCMCVCVHTYTHVSMFARVEVFCCFCCTAESGCDGDAV